MLLIKSGIWTKKLTGLLADANSKVSNSQIQEGQATP
jgi:hypothetical protein